MKLEEAIKIFRLFSDPKRLKIFLLLLDSELCVCEMMDILKVEQSLLSHQLKVLRDAGLIESRRHGRWIFYGVPPKRQQQLRPLFEAWLKDEIARSRKQGQMVKEKKIWPRDFQGKKIVGKPKLQIGSLKRMKESENQVRKTTGKK